MIEVIKCLYQFGEFSNLRSSDVMLLCNDSSRSFTYNGKKYAPILDTINDILINSGLSTISVARPYSFLKPNQVYGNSVTVNGMHSRAALIEKFILLFKNRKVKQGSQIIDVWLKILKKINPKIIIGIQPSRELCIAAKSMGIWIADFQHGVITDDNYYSLKYREIYEQNGWPSCILCWDASSKNWIEKNYSEYVNSVVIGHPFVDRFVNKDPNDDLVRDSVFRLNFTDSESKNVLYTAQWQKSKKLTPEAVGVTDFIQSMISTTDHDIKWWIRIHPVSMKKFGKNNVFKLMGKLFKGNSNVVWDSSTLEPLPLLLCKANLHVTYYSAATKEAALFSKKTALIAAKTDKVLDWFSHEIESGLATTVSQDTMILCDWINKNITKTVNTRRKVKENSSFLILQIVNKFI